MLLLWGPTLDALLRHSMRKNSPTHLKKPVTLITPINQQLRPVFTEHSISVTSGKAWPSGDHMDWCSWRSGGLSPSSKFVRWPTWQLTSVFHFWENLSLILGKEFGEEFHPKGSSLNLHLLNNGNHCFNLGIDFNLQPATWACRVPQAQKCVKSMGRIYYLQLAVSLVLSPIPSSLSIQTYLGHQGLCMFLSLLLQPSYAMKKFSRTRWNRRDNMEQGWVISGWPNNYWRSSWLQVHKEAQLSRAKSSRNAQMTQKFLNKTKGLQLQARAPDSKFTLKMV